MRQEHRLIAPLCKHTTLAENNPLMVGFKWPHQRLGSPLLSATHSCCPCWQTERCNRRTGTANEADGLVALVGEMSSKLSSASAPTEQGGRERLAIPPSARPAHTSPPPSLTPSTHRHSRVVLAEVDARCGRVWVGLAAAARVAQGGHQVCPADGHKPDVKTRHPAACAGGRGTTVFCRSGEEWLAGSKEGRNLVVGHREGCHKPGCAAVRVVAGHQRCSGFRGTLHPAKGKTTTGGQV